MTVKREKDMIPMRAKLKKESFRPIHSTLIRLTFFLNTLLLGFMPMLAQNGEAIVFSENWNDGYWLEPWSPNNAQGWFSPDPKNKVVAESGRGNVLKVNFAAGDIGGVAGIGNYRIYLDSMYKELYFSWEYYLPPDFDYGFADGNGGGKFFGGLSGGNRTNVPMIPSDTSVGWTYFMMFHNGDYFTYPYFYNHEYWDGYPAGNEITSLVKGQWREVTIRLRVNDANKPNGFVEMFDNGQMVFRKTDYQMTSPSHPEWLIDALLLNVFFGGPSPSPKAQYILFDNLVAWYYPKSSLQYRAGTSESGRTVYAPRVSNYHPNVPNKFTEATYTNASGTIRSHCGFAMPIIHENDFQTSTIEVNSASWLSINVTKFDFGWSGWNGSHQTLRIYNGKGANRTLLRTFDQDVYTTVPSSINVSGNTATIEWQAGSGDRMGFNISYTSDGTGSGNNFTCGSPYAVQNGVSQVVTPTDPSFYTPYTPSNLQVTSKTNNSVSIKWTDNSYIEDKYEVERLGPSSSQHKTYQLNPNSTTFTDNGLESNSTYTYWVRAYNNIGGYSAYSGSVQALTLPPALPINAPSGLQSTGFTENSISISWNDNSTNENGFIVTRALALDPDSTVTILLEANATSYTDDSLQSNTSYVYTVKAVNNSGTSAASNKNVASTLSVTETKRVKDGLIAYYNFSYDPNYFVHDLSGFGNPLNLKIMHPAAVSWNSNNRVQINAATAVVSTTNANKITTEIKKSGEITMECWIKPYEPDLSSSSRVISLGLNDSEIGFVLDQNYNSIADEKSLSYSVRVQTESTTKSGFPEITPVNDITFLNLQHVVYIRDSLGNETMFVNGKKSAEGFRPSSFNTWSNSFYLRLGNENDLSHPWQGTFYSLAIYNKALTVGEVNKNYSLGPCDDVINKGQDFSITVYPNPVISEIANVEILPIDVQDYIPQTSIRVLDIYGRIHYQTVIFNPGEQYQTTLDFSRFARGIYFLQVLSGITKKSAKLIVQ